MSKIAAVVVTYNRKHLLKQNLDALINQTVSDFDIIVIDNASTDGTGEFISDTIIKYNINYIKLNTNIGGAGGFNCGVKTALQNGYDYIWIMDDDTVPHTDALQKFLKADGVLGGNYGFLSGVALWTDGTLCKMNVQKLLPLKKNEKPLVKHNLVPTNYATFVSFFVKADAVREVGLPIKDFFIWGDDVEYSGRIAKKYRCYVVKDSFAVHKTASNVGSNIATDGADRISRYAYAYRNEMYIARKNGFFAVVRQCAKIVLHLFRVLFKSKDGRLEKCRIILENSHKGMSFDPNIESADHNVKTVLHVFGEPLSNGGQEAFVMNICKNIDRENLNFDFYTPFYCTNDTLRANTESMGGHVYEGGGRFLNEGSKSDFVNNLRLFLKTHKYQTVHIHSGSIFALCMGAKLARQSGARKVIVHSHSTGTDNIKYRVIKMLSAPLFKKYATHFCACSETAGEWKFPRSADVQIIPNGIDADDFAFSQSVRQRYRDLLSVGDSLVLCHVGRLSKEKNHSFLIDIMKNITLPDVKLLLVGDGPEKENIQKKVYESGLSDKIIMLGVRSDISGILQASDVFLFPSVYEGLGIAAIEAQCTGLKTLCSTAVPPEAAVTDICKRLPLSVEKWIREISGPLTKDREKYADILCREKYTAKDAADKLTKIYLEN